VAVSKTASPRKKAIETQTMTAGEQSSINSFKSFAFQMLKMIHTKMLDKLDLLYNE
jgi:hypothetical protein